MKLNKTAHEAFRTGGDITDEELKDLCKFYDNLEESLRQMGLEYALAWREVYHEKNRLNEYRGYRLLKAREKQNASDTGMVNFK